MSEPPVPSVRTYLLVWVGLILLLGATLASAYVHLGAGNLVINLGIAVAKALLVAAVFMHLKAGGVMNRLAGVVGLLWLAVLIGLTLTDYLTRG